MILKIDQMSQKLITLIESALDAHMSTLFADIQTGIKGDYDINIPTEQLQRYTTQQYVAPVLLEKPEVVDAPPTKKQPEVVDAPPTKKQTAAAAKKQAKASKPPVSKEIILCSQVKKKGGETCKRKAAVGSSLCTFHGKIEDERKEVVVDITPEIKRETKEKKWVSIDSSSTETSEE